MPTIVSKEQYFETALDVLAEVGFKAQHPSDVHDPGCHHRIVLSLLRELASFVDALLEYWEHRQERILRDLSFGSGGPEDDLAALRTLTLGLPHAAEAAIRRGE